MMKFTSTIALLCLAAVVSADVYMMNPRGSNNRCDEQTNDRNNAARLMNTQNNAAGGYPVAPSMYYYEGSVLTFEWTNQHSCGSLGKTGCDVIWQYACDDTFKDGESEDPTGAGGGNTCTNTITEATQNDADVGRHESFAYFDACNNRERNKGLFNAAENVNNNNGAQATRQNAGGGASGFECQEERDYYPYWHPTPFNDIAVLTTNLSRCDFYKKASQNVVGYNYCTAPAHNNEDSCTAGGGSWEVEDKRGGGAPDCQEVQWSRDNALSTTTNGYLMSYNWTVPNDENEACFVRVRYNISTGDYDPWSGINAADNGAGSPVQDDPVVMFGDMPLQMAIDTNQFGRTFEDRSHVFEIRSAPLKTRGLFSNLYNLNVRGKRGNIAQVRNCVEYDFVPQRLHVKVGDYVHFQWTGSNHQPNGNAGEGKNRWDRHNMVQMVSNDMGANYIEPSETQDLFDDEELAWRAAHIAQDQNVDCASAEDVDDGTVNDQDSTNCAKLNGNPTGYFDVGVFRMNHTGQYHFMSTRNNNFTNRGQKGTLLVKSWIWAALAFLLMGAAAVAVVGAAAGGVYYVSAGAGAGAAGAAGGRKSGGSSRRSWGSSGSKHSARSKGTRGSSRSKGSFGGSMI